MRVKINEMALKLSDKKLLVPIIVALITTFGIVSVSGYTSGAEATDTVSKELANHETSLNPHLGTSTALGFIHDDVKGNTDSIDKLTDEIRYLHMAVCSIKEVTCKPKI